MRSCEICYNFMEIEYLCGDKKSLSPDIFNTEVKILYLSWFCRLGVAWGRSKFAITSWNLNICEGTKKFVPRQFEYKSDHDVFIMV